MAVQLGIRRAAIQKGAARALPRMRDVVSGCRAHARQHEVLITDYETDYSSLGNESDTVTSG